MRSQQRFRVLVYLVLAGFVILLYFTSQARQSRDVGTRSLHDFYSKTVNAMDKGHKTKAKAAPHDVDADGDIDDDDETLAKEMTARLRQAEKKAKDLARAKGPNKPDVPEKVIGVGSSASGQDRTVAKGKGDPEPQESKEDHEVETELDAILKKSPVIIFSKSYCPHSKRAKGILLEKYVIEPTPHVVELDLHPLGAKIQARLGEMTGRKTVPNVMIYGKSIGGGDDIAALDKDKALVDKITSLGGTRIEVAERFVEAAHKAT